ATITALGGVAGACGGPADGRAVGVAGPVRGRAGARLGDVAVPGRGAAHGGRGLEAVGGALVVHTVAKLGVVAGAGRRPADRRALGVGGAVRARAGAPLGDVAVAGRGAAHGSGGLELVFGAVIVYTVASLVVVAGTGCRSAFGRALGVGGAVRARAGALLGDVALAGRGAAHGGGGLEAVRRTLVLDAVAALGRVARACGGPALGRALGVGGAAGARPGAEVVHVARAGRGPAERAARREGVRRTVILDAVAALGRVARACGGPARGRALGVGGAVRARAGAEVVHVARAGRGPAERAARREGGRRTGVVGPITALRRVARARRGAPPGPA